MTTPSSTGGLVPVHSPESSGATTHADGTGVQAAEAVAAPATQSSADLVWGEGMPLRGDRIHRYVTCYCPHCHAEGQKVASVTRLAGWLAERDGRIWLERGCPSHGFIRTMYEEDPAILTYLEQWTAPTKWHVPDTEGNYDPIPQAYLRGLGEMQTQHTCILLEDIIEGCNLKCPVCFTDAAPALTGVVPVAEVLANVDQRLARENGRIDVVMLSGGEPTIHPQLSELIEELVERNCVRILVNSNGVEFARDDSLIDLFHRHRERVEVYLQFDGFAAEASKHHRGGDLRKVKEAAIRRLSEAQVFTTLTMTASLGVNDHEIGDVVMLGLETPFIGGVSIQPVFGSGRTQPIDPLERLTNTGVLARLESQTGGVVRWDDLTALPCSHPHCASVGYMLRGDSGGWRSLAGIIGHDRLKQHLGLVANRIADSEINHELKEAVKQSLLGLLSEQSSLSHPSIGQLWRDVCDACDLGVSSLMKLAASAGLGRADDLRKTLGERVMRITVKPFMDMNTMIEERLAQCCVHVGTKNADAHQCAPFCAVQAWPELSQQRISLAVGRTPQALPRLTEVSRVSQDATRG